MLELNKVLLVGNLTRDPEYRSTPSGKSVARLGLAVNRTRFNRESGGREDDTVFIDVDAWEKLAEFSNKYLAKGRRVFVEGRLKMDTWQDKETGRNRSKIGVTAERIQFADPKPSGEGSGAERSIQSHEPAASHGNWDRSANDDYPGGGAGTEDDLPF